MPALVAGIYDLNASQKDVDGRNKSGHDEVRTSSSIVQLDPAGAGVNFSATPFMQ
jgi:hypothetical protein